MAGTQFSTAESMHPSSMDCPRYKRLTRDVRKVCSQVGIDLSPETRDQLIGDLYAEGYIGGRETRREIRPTLAELAGAGRVAAGDLDPYLWVILCEAILLPLLWLAAAPAGASLHDPAIAIVLAGAITTPFLIVRLRQIWRR